MSALAWWTLLTLCVVLFALLVGAIAIAVARGARARALRREPPVRPSRRALAIATSIGAGTITLSVLLGAFALTGRAVAEVPSTSPLSVAIVGHRSWWEITYRGACSSKLVTTANELHLPVGRTVILQIDSDDIIRSLSIPMVSGRRDLVPGRPTVLTIRAVRSGAYRTQSAALPNVAFWVIAERPADFESWLAAQRRPAPSVDGATSDERVRRGRDLFMSGSCPMCHAVGGTLALGAAGPDLTHVASRATVTAGTLPRTPGHLAAWLLGPQPTTKAWNAAPPIALVGEELDDLLAYLDALK